MVEKIVIIVHYNTQKLTDCTIKSLNLHTRGCNIYIFDNSDKYPFVNTFDNVTVIDNTKGQIINFEKWLEQYPNRLTSGGRDNNWGSAKHCYTIQKCIDMFDKPFLLLDSDVLIKRDVSNLFDENYTAIGDTEIFGVRLGKKPRMVPFICFLNVTKIKELGIKYFDDKRMFGFHPGTQDELYDTGGSFYEDVKDNGFKKINNKLYIEHYRSGSWLEDARTKQHYKRIDPDTWLNNNKRLWAKKINKKVVYTCITGGYDTLMNPSIITDDFDYICFTDSESIQSDVWNIRAIPNELLNLSKVKQQRNIKICPHKYLPEYDISIWVDGSMEIKGDLNSLLDKELDDDVSIYIPQHPTRNCIYKEAIAIANIQRDTMANMTPQLNRYKSEGYPENNGLVQSNIIIRWHNNQDCIKLMDFWVNELNNGSHRDQISFNYSLWRNKDVKIKLLNKMIFASQWFKWHGHHHNIGGKVQTLNGIHPGMKINKHIPTTTTKPKKVIRKIMTATNTRDKISALRTRIARLR